MAQANLSTEFLPCVPWKGMRMSPPNTRHIKQFTTEVSCSLSVNGSVQENALDKRFLSPSYVVDRRCIESFTIRSYEVGINRKASIQTIAGLFQEVACNHARSVGFSTDGFATTLSMRKHGLIWVMTRMHIEVEEYPLWGEKIEIETWFQFEGKLGTRRDWRITNANGRVLARATSTFALMNQNTRRLSRISEDVRDEFSLYVVNPPRYVFIDDSNKKQIFKLDEYENVKENLVPSRADLDMNQHVNNVTYIDWILESLPMEVTSTYELKSLTLEFRCECKNNDVITSGSSSEINGSNLTYVHLVKFSDNNKEVSRSRTVWRKPSHL